MFIIVQPKIEEAIKAVSQSFDDSEGGMDGLMQTLACEVRKRIIEQCTDLNKTS